ncbi:MAG: YeeE/YedE family protein [Rhizobiaceae bacterium]|nr:YeeE/YedE family protein [Rhizobiaceae bacterium]
MKSFVTALLIGLVFGTGIAISGMINPAKVLNFFDLFGTWDPSLAIVMASALVTAMIGYRLVFGKFPKPVLTDRFAVPKNITIDARLLTGSTMFGVGWGISGFCPGGSIPALGMGESSALLFFASMIVGIVVARTLNNAWQRPSTI